MINEVILFHRFPILLPFSVDLASSPLAIDRSIVLLDELLARGQARGFDRMLDFFLHHRVIEQLRLALIF